MPFRNLQIQRVIIHEVAKRDDSRTPVDPTYGTQVITLEPEARDALQVRITAALGHASHGIEMTIRKVGPESVWQKAKRIFEAPADETVFIAESQGMTANLANAQANKTIPGGIVVVVYGMAGHPGIPFVAVIKAEPHPGFTRSVTDTGDLALQFIKDLILTPQAKLYKIGAFIQPDPAADVTENPAAGWRAFLFDDLITSGNRQNAALYFFDTFLGLAFPTNSAWQTKQFHSLTKDFIKTANIPPETKSDLLGALTAYLKVDQSGTIQVSHFGSNYFDTAELQDSYVTYMQAKEFPMTAIHKDLSEVRGALKDRRITFGNNIRLTGPVEQFQDRIRMRTIDGERTADGIVPKWTEIIVRDQIRDQE